MLAKARRSFVWLLLMCVLANAPAVVGQASTRQSQGDAQRGLPGAGVIIGTTRFGSGDLPPDSEPLVQRLDEAIEGGLGGFTVYVDWPAVEPSPGEYDFIELLAVLDRLHARGLATFVNLTIGDIGDYVVPAEFSDGQGGLAEGIELDDPEVLDRLGGLLLALVPELLNRGVFALALGNEIDDRLDGEFADELDAYAAFVAAAESLLQDIEPRLEVGVTLTATAHLNDSLTRRVMAQAGDFVAVNYGPIDPDWFVLEPAAIVQQFRRLLDSFGDERILIQELTCPSALSMGASEDWQAECFRILFDILIADPRVKFASVFTLEDFSGAVCESIREVFRESLAGLPDDFVRRFMDYLCAMGVLRADGQAKPAWSVLLDSVGSANSRRRLELIRRGLRSPPDHRDLLRNRRLP